MPSPQPDPLRRRNLDDVIAYQQADCATPHPRGPRPRHWHQGHDMHQCTDACPSPGSPVVCTGCGAIEP